MSDVVLCIGGEKATDCYDPRSKTATPMVIDTIAKSWDPFYEYPLGATASDSYMQICMAYDDEYPDDIGVLSPLVLNLVCLRPGEAMYLPAGELHAYLHGTGIELMANSDNVLRGGLTPKHVDLDELLNVLTFKEKSVERLMPEKQHDGVSRQQMNDEKNNGTRHENHNPGSKQAP